MEKAVFGAGCFWGVEAFFEQVRGVEQTRVGYSGGFVVSPTYEQVKTGKTGHAEVVEVIYNPWKISYHELVELFFTCHNPTTLNRQGIDKGTQYRSVIFFETMQQVRVVRKIKDELNKKALFTNKIVTEITPMKAFYRAEDYHQKYFQKNENVACGL